MATEYSLHNMRVRRESTMAWRPFDGMLFRSVINYCANGDIDRSRSHYSIGGRKVSRRTFRRRYQVEMSA